MSDWSSDVCSSDLKFFADFPMSEITKNNPPTQVLSTTTKVQERSGAGYVRLDLASANSRLRGNVGVRYVVTQEASSGFVPTPDAKLVYGYLDRKSTRLNSSH